MFKAIQIHKEIIIYFGIWIIAGKLADVAGYLVAMLMFLSFKRRDWRDLLVIALWFTLILSDNGKGLNFTKNIKPIIMALSFLFVWFDKTHFKFKSDWYKYLIPFFCLASFLWLRNPNPVDSLQKTISLILLFITVPSLLMNAYTQSRQDFLFRLIWFAWMLIAISIIGYFIVPSGFTFAQRFCGIFRNPNGLGVFVVLYFFLYSVVKDIFPQLFSKKDEYIIFGTCLLAIILCGSRGALFALGIFLIFRQFYKISPYVGFFIMVLSISTE